MGRFAKVRGEDTSYFHSRESQRFSHVIRLTNRRGEKYCGTSCARSYRTLRDGSLEGVFPGTSCQATIGLSLQDSVSSSGESFVSAPNLKATSLRLRVITVLSSRFAP